MGEDDLMVKLSDLEEKRMHELLKQYQIRKWLTPAEADELSAYIKKRQDMEQGEKMLVLFALGALAGYGIAKMLEEDKK